jgi:porin
MRHGALCGLILGFASGAAPARGQQQAAPATPQSLGLPDWLQWTDMTGNWGGLRDTLASAGIVFRGHYVAEAAGNPVGGHEQGGAYTGEVMLGADMDSKVLGWAGGTFHLTLTERAGSSLSQGKIGNILTVQEVYGGGQTVRLSELSFEQQLFDDRVEVAAGRVNVEEDFASSPVYFGDSLWCSFESNAICGTPIAAPLNSDGYVADPASTWGARIKLAPRPNIYVQAGVYAVDPTLNDSKNGFKLGTNGVDGVFTTVETGITIGSGLYQGNYRIGAYYDNSDNPPATSQVIRYLTPQSAAALAALPPALRAGRYGGWVIADQTVQLDPGTTKRGIVVFAALEWGDRQTAFLNWFGEAGVVRQGTFPGRGEDRVALGFAAASINGSLQGLEQRLGAPTSVEEYMAELTYSVALAPWLELRPGVQYIWHPSGINEIPNAFVIELTSVLTF